MRDCYLILVKNKCLSKDEFLIIKYIKYKLNIKKELMLQTVISELTLRNFFEPRPNIAAITCSWTKALYVLYDLIRNLNRAPQWYI